jgi:serine protease inhibitor
MILRTLILWLAFSFPLMAQSPNSGAESGPNRHAWEMFQLFRPMTKGNFCFSPFSGHRLASVLAEGARGETQRQLIELAHLAADRDQRASESEAIRNALASSSAGQGMLLEVANSIWVPPTATLEPDYLAWIEKHYGLMTQPLPSTDAVGRAMKVNQWIRQKTRGRVTDLVGPNQFQSSGNALLLVNSVYLKSRWAHPFEPRATKPRTFTMHTGSSKILPMMTQTHAFLFADSPAWLSAELPFAGGDFCMTLLLPRTEADRDAVESGLNPESWSKLVASLTDADVSVMLPRFAFSAQLNLQGMWQSLGALNVFEEKLADFSGMTRQKPCWVNEVQHEASIEVNELGAEAAAATVAAQPFGEAGEKPKRRSALFVANRPFLWVIRHKPTGLILFMGRFAGE